MGKPVVSIQVVNFKCSLHVNKKNILVKIIRSLSQVCTCGTTITPRLNKLVSKQPVTVNGNQLIMIADTSELHINYY